MTEATVTCPQCKAEFKLNESLAAPLLESVRLAFEKKLAQKDADIARKEGTLREREAALAKSRETLDQQIADKLKLERGQIAAEEGKKAKAILAADLEQRDKKLSELNEVLKARDEKLTQALKAQIELIKKERELDDARREMELNIEKKVQESLGLVREQARKDAQAELGLKVLEKDQTIHSMMREIETLKRKAEQGSQQLQGEAQELMLEAILQSRFPHDQIEPVPKGQYGGDVIQRILLPTGMLCGTILWETKRTKNWVDGWLSKLREDQRAAKAEIAVLVSAVLPKGVESFDHIDGIWVIHPRMVVPVTCCLRQMLIEVSRARSAGQGQQSKMELVYQYLTGPRFRQRVQAIVEKFTDMNEDLDKERKQMTRLWAKREEQIRGVIDSTVGMYGDLQGIVGKTLEEIEGLEFKLLEDQSPLPDPTQAG